MKVKSRLRRKVFERDGGQCTSCHSSKYLHVHHLTYERAGSELLSDLVTLCSSCHMKEHVKLRGRQCAALNIDGTPCMVPSPRHDICHIHRRHRAWMDEQASWEDE
jgi:hypothetical protein